MQAGHSLWATCDCAGKLYCLVSTGSGHAAVKKLRSPPSSPGNAPSSLTFDSGGKTTTVSEDLGRLKKRLSLLE
jgi:hypothetical protein